MPEMDALDDKGDNGMRNRIIALALCAGMLIWGGCGLNETAVTDALFVSEAQEDENDTLAEQPVPVDDDNERLDASPGISMPYHELAFSVEDFKYAGYSVMDGDHAEDIFQTVSGTFVSARSYKPELQWVYWPEIEYPKDVQTFYYKKRGTVTNTTASITYSVNDQEQLYHAPHTEISLSMRYSEDGELGEKITAPNPFLEGPIQLEMSYEEVLDNLGLTEIVSAAKLYNVDGDYTFDSQYGETHCIFNYTRYLSTPEAENITITYENALFGISFLDGLVFDINCKAIYEDDDNVFPDQGDPGETAPQDGSTRMISDPELLEAVKSYYENTYGTVPPYVELDHYDGDNAVIHIYDVTGGHTSTWDWYTIDRYTGSGTNFMGEEIHLMD